MGTPTGAKDIDHRNLLAERDQMFNFTPPHVTYPIY